MKISKQMLKQIIREELKDLNEGLKRFKVYVSGESEPLILLGKNEKDVKEICKICDGAVVGSSIVKIIEKNKEFSDIIDLANDKPVSGNVTPEMNKAVEVLKKNSDLKQTADLIKNNELLIEEYLKLECQWGLELAGLPVTIVCS